MIVSYSTAHHCYCHSCGLSSCRRLSTYMSPKLYKTRSNSKKSLCFTFPLLLFTPAHIPAFWGGEARDQTQALIGILIPIQNASHELPRTFQTCGKHHQVEVRRWPLIHWQHRMTAQEKWRRWKDFSAGRPVCTGSRSDACQGRYRII